MSRYIDADKLIDDIRPFAEYDSNRRNKDWVRRFEIAIDAQPTADVRKNIHAKKVIGGGECDGATCWFECSHCHGTVDIEDAYCKHCGAVLEYEK